MTATPPAPQQTGYAGILWLLADMSLISMMGALVKWQGGTYSAPQLVFLRAVAGALIIAPMIWTHRAEILSLPVIRSNMMRVACNGLALACSFAALASLPLAVVSASNYARPIVLLALAALLLNERIPARRWWSSLLALCGVALVIGPAATAPGAPLPLSGLAAAGGAIIFGVLAVILMRQLVDQALGTLMVFYTLGLGVIFAVPAALLWQPVRPADWPVLILIGALAQLGQLCFLRAHRLAQANQLAPWGYISVIFATMIGILVFDEIPTALQVLGLTIVLASVLVAQRRQE
ncbi:DMT family transporter [Roseinatronobacter alkalisoli]|uniref:DMT family transporter n=1 Tax=Roseinatronobacter alkalisoli TaxID=3028235 RepID=A0ABT5TFX4_9RHOB|nr:DMT family transporter [Roseinatronobacter sp. HJB301]MDD7973052.1 DMT family transporter [Roseinatronobacter sp. HJB301]